MNRLKYLIFVSVVCLTGMVIGCSRPQQPKIDLRPYQVVAAADSFYQQAIALMNSTADIDSAYKCLRLVDEAFRIDSLNPDYYGIKAKLLAELGLLDSALMVQTLALEKQAINGDYLFQLGLFQAAREMKEQAHESFAQARDYLRAVVEVYPDSLPAFIYAEAAHALCEGTDSLFMKDLKSIRERFPKRLMEIEMVRRMKPSRLVKEIRSLAIQKDYQIDFDLDSLVDVTVKQHEQMQQKQK